MWPLFIYVWLAITIFSQSNNLPDYQNIKLSCHWQFPLTQNNKILFVVIAMLLSLLQFSAFPSPLMHLMYKCYLALLILFISTLQSRLVSKEKGAKSKENISKDQNIYSRYILSSSLASIVGNGKRTNKIFFYYQFLLINKFTTQDYLKYEGNKETITSSKLVRGGIRHHLHWYCQSYIKLLYRWKQYLDWRMLSLRIQSVSVGHRGSLCVSEITEWIIIGSSVLIWGESRARNFISLRCCSLLQGPERSSRQ